MEFRQLKTFRAVASLCSYSKAAEYLYYAQSTVSEQIKALEDDLKVKLFRQSGRSLMLTESGEALLQYAQRMLNLEEEIRAEIGGYAETHGFLNIKVPETFSSFFLPQIVIGYTANYPKVGLKFSNCSFFNLEKELLSGIVNLAFLITDAFRSPDLETEVLAEMPLVLAAGPGHPLASVEQVSGDMLRSELVLFPINDCSYVLMIERKLAEKEKVELENVLRFNSIEPIKKTVMSGRGCTILPLAAVKNELDKGALKELPWPGGPLQANLLMIRQKSKWVSPILDAFMEETRRLFGGQMRG